MKSTLGFSLVVAALGWRLSALAAAADVSDYTLINDDTDLPIMALTPGMALDLATLPTRHLSIRATTAPATMGSVVFNLSGASSQSTTENVAPYALFSDENGDCVGQRQYPQYRF